MACLRSFSGRSLYPKWFSYKTSSSVLHPHHHYPVPSFPNSSLLIRSFHKNVFLKDRTKMSFPQPFGYGSEALLCGRYMSSKPEESSSKFDAFGKIVDELVSENSVEAMATNTSTIDQCTTSIENLSFPAEMVHYVVNGIHELTGFNWWMSIVLTAFLVSGLMSPVSLRIQKKVQELIILVKGIRNVERIKKVGNSEAVATCKKWQAELMKGFVKAGFSFLSLLSLDVFIYMSFIDGINIMAKQIPELSTSHNIYILPLVTGFTFWLSSEYQFSRTNLISRMKRLPLFLIFFIVLQATYEYESAMYIYVITSRVYLSTLFLIVRSKEIVKLRSILGWSDVSVSEKQMIIRRLISLMREFIDVVKKNDKK